MNMLSNNWTFVFVVGVVLALVVGATQYRMLPDDLKIRKGFSDRVFSLIGKVFGVSVAIMAAFESTDGIVQILDNYLGGVKNDAWSLLLFPIAVALIGIVVWAIVGVVGLISSRIKRAGLRSVRRDAIKQRQKSAAQRYHRSPKKFEDIEQYKNRRRVG